MDPALDEAGPSSLQVDYSGDHTHAGVFVGSVNSDLRQLEPVLNFLYAYEPVISCHPRGSGKAISSDSG